MGTARRQIPSRCASSSFELRTSDVWSTGRQDTTMAAGIGETLRATRRQQRLSLAEAAAEIRVREPYLAALEEEKFAKLGGDVYVRAFLRGYSEFLGLDPDQVVEAYRREHERAIAPRPPRELPSDAPTVALPPTTGVVPSVWDGGDDDYDDPEPRGSFFPRAVVLAGVVLLLLVVAVLGLRQRDVVGVAGGAATSPAQSSVVIPTPDVQPSAQTVVPSPTPTVEPTIAAAPPPAPTPTPPPPQGPLTELNVQLTVTDGPSWLRATADGSVAEVGIFEPGTTFTWTADEELLLRIGDASNVRVLVNGVDQGVLGGERQPVDLEYRIGQPA
jgi:cytoskeleton protein RodZ